MSYRSRWFEQHNLEYFPPKLGDCPPFRCVGHDTEQLYKRLTGGEIGKRQRIPGDDDGEPVTWGNA